MPLVARSGAPAIEALTGVIALFPFLLRGVDFDGLLMNERSSRGVPSRIGRSRDRLLTQE